MKTKLFYGWWMLIGLMLMYATTNGIGMYAFGVLRKMQMAEAPYFGLDPQTQAALPALLFMVVAFISPIIGILLDRYSTRVLIAIGAFLAIALIFVQQFMTSYGGLQLIYALFAIAMSLSGIISFMYLVNKWFRQYIGRAAGILLVGSSLGGLVFPNIAAAAGNWQATCNWLGFAAMVFLLPPLLLIRNKPEDVGEVPDGNHQTVAQTNPSAGNQNNVERTLEEEGVSLKTALRTPSFYLVLVVTATLWFCINGYLQNHPVFMTDLNKNAQETASIVGIFSMMAILGKLLFGWLSDKYERRFIMAASIATMLIAVVLAKMSMTNTGLLQVFALIFGIGFGGSFTIIQIWVADIYAGKNFGTILGVVTMIDTLAGSSGMIALGNMRKTSGSFDSGFNTLIVLCIIAFVSAFLVKKPKN
jgi:sugar phosphate permease